MFLLDGLVTVLKDFQLMKSPHAANEAQNHFEIDLKDVGEMKWFVMRSRVSENLL